MAQPFYVTEQISSNRYFTDEGFLVCIGCPITRTGTLKYNANEIPVTPGPDGTIVVFRNADEVFREETIASAVGKPVCNNHPPQDVDPASWKDLAVGTILHPRRGEGEDHDCLVADLIITDQEAIQLVLNGKKELSCGYDVDYEELAPGIARHYNIRFNHVAIVDEGRAGPRCAVKDDGMTRTIDVRSIDLTGMGSEEGFLEDRSPHVHVHVGKGHTVEGNDGMRRHARSDDSEERIEKLEDTVKKLHRALNDRRRSRSDDDDDRRGRGRSDDDDDRRGRSDDRRGRSDDRRGRSDDDDDGELRISHSGEDRRRYRSDDDEEECYSDDRRYRGRSDDDDDDDWLTQGDRRRHRSDDNEEEEEEEEFEFSERVGRSDDRRRGRSDDRHRGRSDDRRRRRSDDRRRHRADDKRILGHLEFEAPPGTALNDARRRHRSDDSVSDSYQDTVAMAEIIVPGIMVPTYDSVAGSQTPGRRLHVYRCRVMDAAMADVSTRNLVHAITGDDRFDPREYRASELSFIFRTVANAKRGSHNGSVRAVDDGQGRTSGTNQRVTIRTAADLNNLHREFYKAGE
jgi:hypothetical protein